MASLALPRVLRPIAVPVVVLAASLALQWAAGPAAPLAAVPVVALYHRLGRDAALEHPVRARLFEAVAAQPGITIQAAAAKVGVARTTASYHLRILGREGLLLERPARKTVHYYRNDGRLTDLEQLRLQALASARTREVARLVTGGAGAQRSELAAVLGVSIATVNWHLRPLLAHGLLEEVARGRRRYVVATEALRQNLALLGAGAEREGMPPAEGVPPPLPGP